MHDTENVHVENNINALSYLLLIQLYMLMNIAGFTATADH